MPPEFISPLSLYGFKLLAVIKDGVRVAEKSLVISFGQLPLWARSTHPTMKKADLQVECRLSVVNPHNTAHSTEPAPQAAMAELLPLAIRQVSELCCLLNILAPGISTAGHCRSETSSLLLERGELAATVFTRPGKDGRESETGTAGIAYTAIGHCEHSPLRSRISDCPTHRVSLHRAD